MHPLAQRVIVGNRKMQGITSWDGAKKNSLITLSADLLTATGTAGGAGRIVKATWDILWSPKAYWETLIVAIPATAGFAVGIANAAEITTDGQYLGGLGNNSIGAYDDGNVFLNDTSVGTIMTLAAGDNMGIALDRPNNKIHFRKNGGNWNNTTDNPTTNTGGFDISAITGALFAAMNLDGADSATGLFSRRSWLYAPPQSFGPVI